MVGMPEALLALGGSLLAAGTALSLVIHSRREEQAQRQMAAVHRERMEQYRQQLARRADLGRGSFDDIYIINGNVRLNGIELPRTKDVGL